MGSLYDIERVFPGTEHDEFTKENLTELNQRIVKLETILAQHVTQWNAPSLLQTLNKTEYKIQMGNHTQDYNGGAAEFAIPLTTPWPIEHRFFWAAVNDVDYQPNNYTFNARIHKTIPLGYGIIKCYAGDTDHSQDWTWISIGK